MQRIAPVSRHNSLVSLHRARVSLQNRGDSLLSTRVGRLAGTFRRPGPLPRPLSRASPTPPSRTGEGRLRPAPKTAEAPEAVVCCFGRGRPLPLGAGGGGTRGGGSGRGRVAGRRRFS